MTLREKCLRNLSQRFARKQALLWEAEPFSTTELCNATVPMLIVRSATCL